MKNGEVKIYRNKKIRKVAANKYSVGGFCVYFDSLAAAREAIDDAIAEDEALDEIDRYVREVIGGWL